MMNPPDCIFQTPNEWGSVATFTTKQGIAEYVKLQLESTPEWDMDELSKEFSFERKEGDLLIYSSCESKGGGIYVREETVFKIKYGSTINGEPTFEIVQ